MKYYLIYTSTASDLFSDQELDMLLLESRSYNERAGVTGILLYHTYNFIQVLEGDEVVVRQLFEKICQDSRHRNVTKVLEGYEEQRSFAKWYMGFKKVTKEDINGFNNCFVDIEDRDHIGEQLEKLSNKKILIMLRSYLEIVVS